MDLRSFLSSLPPDEIWRIAEPVPADYVSTALALALEKRERYPVLYFDHIDGFDMPLVCNLFASRDRIAAAFGWQRQDFIRNWNERSDHLQAPVRVQTGPVQELSWSGAELDLGRLPLPTHFSTDAGRYFTAGIVVARDPDSGVQNLSYHRMQLKGKRKLGTSLHSRGGLWDYQRRAEARGQALEVGIFCGAHPALMLGAAARIAAGVSEYDLIGGLLGQPVEVVACQTVDVEVPAEAEIVIEGTIPPEVRETEGPFGEYTGYSSERSTQHVIDVHRVTMRAHPLFVDITPGKSADHIFLSRAPREPLIYRRMKESVPELVDISYPKSGNHFHCYISLHQTAEGQARQAMQLLFGLDRQVKHVVAVDDDIDVHDERQVMWALATRVQADRDLMVMPGVICNLLDPSAQGGVACKMGIDATQPVGKPYLRTQLPEDVCRWVDAMIERRK